MLMQLTMQNVHFFRAANGILAKVGRTTSEVILELLKCKCLPVVLYGLEVCLLDKGALRSLHQKCWLGQGAWSTL